MKVIQFILGIILTITVICLLTITFFLKKFSLNTNQKFSYLPDILKSAYLNPTLSTNTNFIILGLDPRNDTLEKTETTDTIILARITNDFQLKLVALPRDTWDYQTNQKINQYYQKSLNTPNKFETIQQNFSYITGQDINKTLVITTQNLIDLTQIIGGVDVYLENGFTDDKYPNPEYIISPSPKIPIYTTISFPQGNVHLDQTNITQFVRSRKSAETSDQGGTDIGRARRQQLLLEAIVSKLKHLDYLHQSDVIAKLYNHWHQLETNISDTDLLSLAIHNYHRLSNFKIDKTEIPTGENQKTDILFHPNYLVWGQWVYLPQDKNYQSLHEFISRFFDGKSAN